MDTGSFLLSVNTKDIIRDLKSLEDIIDFKNLHKSHELFSKKNKKVLGKFKIETPKHLWFDEFVCLRSKMYTLKCDDDRKNKLKGISKSQSEHIKFEYYKNCLDGKEYQKECNNYNLRSFYHEIYLQEVKKINIIFSR